MKGPRFTEHQIIRILREVEGGITKSVLSVVQPKNHPDISFTTRRRVILSIFENRAG